MQDELFPPLPYDAWADTKDTLHLFLQIIGKVRMAAHPKLNHWWHVTLFPDTRGLTTGRIPFQGRSFEIRFDMVEHAVHLSTNDGGHKAFAVMNGEGTSKTVAAFYTALFEALDTLGLQVKILAKPFDNVSTTPFAADHAPRSYDGVAVTQFWRALCSISSVFEGYRSYFVGKQTPVQLYWHSFDLVSTRFSGKAAPLESGRQSDIEAYSHEVISTGFWPGDASFRQAAFYAYAYPEPPALNSVALQPDSAQWIDKNGAMAILTYDAMRAQPDPQGALMDFLQSFYQGAADKAGWDRSQLSHAFVDHP